MKGYIARVNEDRGRCWWIWSDAGTLLKGVAGEPQKAVLNRFQFKHGKLTELVRYKGTMRPSEAAMSVADARRSQATREDRKSTDPAATALDAATTANV